MLTISCALGWGILFLLALIIKDEKYHVFDNGVTLFTFSVQPRSINHRGSFLSFSAVWHGFGVRLRYTLPFQATALMLLLLMCIFQIVARTQVVNGGLISMQPIIAVLDIIILLGPGGALLAFTFYLCYMYYNTRLNKGVEAAKAVDAS